MTIKGIYSKASAALQSLQLSATARAVRNERLTYLSIPKLRRLENILDELDTRQIAGDYLEFGVALGGSAILIAKAAQRLGREFTGFDVFGMIPPPDSDRDDEKSKQRYKTIAEGRSEGIGGDRYYGYRDDLYGDVVRAFSRHGLTVGEKGLSLERGLFHETYPRRQSRPVAFAHIDCDWYEPVHYCLNALNEVLVPGGVILIDDYHDYGGAQTATKEFLTEHPAVVFEDGPNVALRR